MRKYKDEDKEFEAFMNLPDDDHISKSLGNPKKSKYGGSKDNTMSIGSRINTNSYKSMSVNAYEPGGSVKPKRKKKKRRRKKKKKKAENDNNLIPDSLFSDQPLRETKISSSFDQSDDEKDLFSSVKSKFGDKVVLKNRKKVDLSSVKRHQPYVITPRDKIGNDLDLSMRLSSTIDKNDSILLGSKKTQDFENSFQNSSKTEGSSTNNPYSEDDEVSDISYNDITNISSGTVNIENRNAVYGSSDDDLIGPIQMGTYGIPTPSKKSFHEISSSNKSNNMSDEINSINLSNSSDPKIENIDPYDESEHDDDDENIVPKKLEKQKQSSSVITVKANLSNLEIEKLKDALTSTNEKLSDLNFEYDELKSKYSEIEILKNDFFEKYQTAVSELNEIRNEVEEKDERISSLEATLSSLNTDNLEESLEEWKRKCSNLEIEKNKIQKQIDETSPPDNSTETNKELFEELNDLRNELKETKLKLKNSNQKNLNMSNEVLKLQKSEESSLKELSSKNEFIKDLESTLEDKISVIEKLELEKNDGKSNELKNLEKLFSATQEENERIFGELKSLKESEKQRKVSNELNLKTLKQKNIELEDHNSLLRSEKEKYSNYSLKISELKKEKDSISRVFEDERIEWKNCEKKLNEEIKWWKNNQELISEKEKIIDSLKEELENLKFADNSNNPVLVNLQKENAILRKKIEDPMRLSKIFEKTVKEHKNGNQSKIDELKNEIIEVKDSAAKSMRALRQEFEKTKNRYEKRIEELKKKKSTNTNANTNTNISPKNKIKLGNANFSGKLKILETEKKKQEEVINEKNEKIIKIEEEQVKLKSSNSLLKKKAIKLEKKISRFQNRMNTSKKKEEEILRITQRYEDQLFRLEKENQTIISELKMNHEKLIQQKEKEIKNLPFDEKSRRLFGKVEELMSQVSGFESSNRVLKLKQTQEIEEIKAEHEFEKNKIRREFNKLLQTKSNQVKKFKLMLDQIMEDISRFKKVKDFEMSQISLIQKSMKSRIMN